MRDINTDAASGHPQLCTLQNESEDRIRFTPVKRAADIIPRVWDRKPSTSYLAKSSRPRKVWKRFRTSFNSMKALQQMVDAASKRIEEDDLNTEINSSRNSSLLRGLKRRCLDTGREEDAKSGVGGRRSFLETKWESEIQRRRKIPMNYEMDITTAEHCDYQTESDQQPVTSIADVDTQKDEPAGADMDPAYPEMLHGSSDKDECADVDPTSEPTTDAATEEKGNDITTMDEPLPEASKKETAPAEEIISAEQESTLVRSALRSSLDVDDAEVLNNFLTKAKAKRAAKAAMAAQEQTAAEKTVQEEEVAIPNLPTPRSRRALEELDANSPSPSPQKVASARKAEDVSGSPVSKKAILKGDKPKNSPQQQQQQQQQQPASPTATRRSTRTRTPRAPPKSNIPTPQNTLSLRRAKGNEFVFLQRTEAQELALVTRKNTKNNKGNSVLPKYTLQTLSRGQGSAESSPGSDSSSGNGRSRTGKRVCWNDARLVEYEDGEEPQAAASASPEPTDELSHSITRTGSDTDVSKKGGEMQKTSSSNRSTRSQATVITMPQSPAARRVRRLGSQATTTTSTKLEPTPSASCKSMYTASSTRKKLTPKAPSSGLLGTPPSKKSVSIAASTTTIGSSAGTTTSGRETSTKSKSIFKANAGSTPMPKRVRSRA